jgi:hypothetical protein
MSLRYSWIGWRMNISREDLDWATRDGLISSSQAERLWQKLQERNASSSKSKFDVANVAYYFGALIVMSAMGWLMNLGWERFGGVAISLLAITYAALFFLTGRTLWYKEKLTIPGGLLFTLSVWMTPLAIYGFEQATGIWPQCPKQFSELPHLGKGKLDRNGGWNDHCRPDCFAFYSFSFLDVSYRFLSLVYVHGFDSVASRQARIQLA